MRGVPDPLLSEGTSRINGRHRLGVQPADVTTDRIESSPAVGPPHRSTASHPEETPRTVAAKKNDYSASSITVLEGLEAVRKRPGMYIGSTGERGLHQLIWEGVDNAVDEAMGGYATRVEVTLLADGGCRVEDDGRGIPTDMNTKEKLTGVEIALTKLHGGGKFEGKAYQVSGGLHGVGVSVVNA